eukprot:178909_1
MTRTTTPRLVANNVDAVNSNAEVVPVEGGSATALAHKIKNKLKAAAIQWITTSRTTTPLISVPRLDAKDINIPPRRSCSVQHCTYPSGAEVYAAYHDAVRLKTLWLNTKGVYIVDLNAAALFTYRASARITMPWTATPQTTTPRLNANNIGIVNCNSRLSASRTVGAFP